MLYMYGNYLVPPDGTNGKEMMEAALQQLYINLTAVTTMFQRKRMMVMQSKCI